MTWYVDNRYPASQSLYGIWGYLQFLRIEGRMEVSKVVTSQASLRTMIRDTGNDRHYLVHDSGLATEGKKQTDGRWNFMYTFSV